MRIHAAFIAGAMLLGSQFGAFAASTAAPPRDLTQLDRALGEVFKEGKVPGASVAVIEHDEVTFLKGYGFADVGKHTPATPDTILRAGSISKSLTGIAVMTLVEQGKLSLEGRVAELAPEVRFVNPWEATNPVRLVHLLEHTTGWPDVSLRVYTLDGKGWSTLRGVKEVSPEFVSRWKSGFFPVYNNAGPAVAGFILEKASGQTFSAYLREHVLRPMGMASADFDMPPALQARLAKSYEPDGTETPYQYIILPPAGSLAVSARELAQLVRFFLGRGTVDGTQILTPASVERIERSESTLASRDGFTNGYGLGNAAFPDEGPMFHGHNGGIDSFTSLYSYRVREGSGYVLLANGGEGVDFNSPASRLIKSYLTRDVKVQAPQPYRIEAGPLARYAGVYRTISPPNTLLQPFVETLGMTRVGADSGKLIVSGRTWIPVGPHSFRRDDRDEASLGFVEDGGEIYKISAFNAQRKEPLWRIGLIALVGFLLGLGLLVSIAMLPVWIVGWIRGRLTGRGGSAIRFAPIGALAALALTFALPIAAISSPGMKALHRLADVGPYSLAILVCSILFPLLAALGLWLGVRRREAGWFVRIYACATSLAVLAVAAYAGSIGWIAARTWRM